MDKVFIKKNVNYNEFALALLADKALKLKTPRIISYNEGNETLVMSKLNYSNVADYFGDEDIKTPDYIYAKIRKIVKKLYDSGITYPDITGYNFLIDKNENIWIIDFGHAYVKSPDEPDDPFVFEFINGKNGWNPNYK